MRRPRRGELKPRRNHCSNFSMVSLGAFSSFPCQSYEAKTVGKQGPGCKQPMDLSQVGNWDFCCNAAVPAQNTKKLNRTKNNCVRVQLGQIMNKKIQQPNKQEAQLLLLESQEQKQGVRERVLHMPLDSTPPKGWAKHLNHPSNPTPGHTPLPSPQVRNSQLLPRLPPQEQSREPVLLLPPEAVVLY